MTLVVGVTGPESIWMLADRRLSIGEKPAKDDAYKMMFLDTADGVAILGYAGLGATARGTQPSDWMKAVLRGRNFPLEQSLGVLANAMQSQFPRHLIKVSKHYPAAHNIIVPAFIGAEQRLYSIDLVFASDRKSYKFRYTRHVSKYSPKAAPRTPRLGIGGTGALYLPNNKRWIRKLLQLVRANDQRKISPHLVADQLARLNAEVHLAAAAKGDESVGHRCIVAWRFSEEGVHGGGGGHQFYSGTERDSSSGFMPSISRGQDVSAFVSVLMPSMMKQLKATRAGDPTPELDVDELKAALARLPTKPDEELS